MKLLILLLSLAMVYNVFPFERNTANFRFTPEGYAIIENASEPVRISNYDYYWDGHFQPAVGRPVICEMREDSYGWPLGEVRFENGTKVKAMYYSCPETSFCGMLTCHSKDLSLLVAITILSIFAFLLCMCYVCWFRHRVQEDRDEPFEMRQMIPLVLTAENTFAGGDAESSMDETPFQIIPPPPRYCEIDDVREDMSLIA